MNGFIVRPLEATDLDAVASLAGHLVRQHHAFDPKRFLDLPNPERGYRGFFERELKDEDAVLLVAQRQEVEGAEEAIVGYAYGRLEPRSFVELRDACGMLHDVYVDASARGAGVGRRLVRETVHRLAAKGAPRVVLLTALQNEAAQALFRRAGFRTTMLEMTLETTEQGDAHDTLES